MHCIKYFRIRFCFKEFLTGIFDCRNGHYACIYTFIYVNACSLLALEYIEVADFRCFERKRVTIGLLLFNLHNHHLLFASCSFSRLSLDSFEDSTALEECSFEINTV